MFNPTVNIFRIHWFSVRPCFQLAFPKSLSKFGASFLTSKRYYETQRQEHPQFSLITLGRRSVRSRKVKDRIYRPHKFWSRYMSSVASKDFRGPWYGLAPMHFQFKPAEDTKMLRLQPHIQRHPEELLKGVTRINAFPKAYLCPIGWVVAVSAEITGSFLLNELPSLVDRMRSQQVFLYKGNPATLQDVLRAMHALISNTLLNPSNHLPTDDDMTVYSVSSPVVFHGQQAFDPSATELGLQAIFGIIGEGPPPSDDRRLVTPGPHTVAVTGFNRGTMLITNGSGSGPECAFSNLKNLLLMTVLMQKYHQRAFGHSDSAVLSMRAEVAKTFRLLENRWEAPHFKQIVANHDGIIRMLSEEELTPQMTPSIEVQTQRLNTILAFCFGLAFISAILYLVVKIPNPTPAQWNVFCVVLALAAGGISTTISGMLRVDLTFGKRAIIAATGALAVFVIVFFFKPASAHLIQ